jgi:hypothetical protein
MVDLDEKFSDEFRFDVYHIVTCYLRSQPIQRFIARKQLCKHATILETLLGSRPHVTMEVELEAVFSMWSAPRLYHASDSSILVRHSLTDPCGGGVEYLHLVSASRRRRRKGKSQI